jgi:hypothetical protein
MTRTERGVAYTSLPHLSMGDVTASAGVQQEARGSGGACPPLRASAGCPEACMRYVADHEWLLADVCFRPRRVLAGQPADVPGDAGSRGDHVHRGSQARSTRTEHLIRPALLTTVTATTGIVPSQEQQVG